MEDQYVTANAMVARQRFGIITGQACKQTHDDLEIILSHALSLYVTHWGTDLILNLIVLKLSESDGS